MDPNHKMLLALLAVFAALGVVYYFQKQGLTVTTPNQTIKLSSVAGSNISGTATFIETDGQTKVTLYLTGSTNFANHPAHIHIGSCPIPGEVKYPLTNVGSTGKSETTLAMTLQQLKAGLPLAINVHQSPEAASTYLSCGNL